MHRVFTSYFTRRTSRLQRRINKHPMLCCPLVPLGSGRTQSTDTPYEQPAYVYGKTQLEVHTPILRNRYDILKAQCRWRFSVYSGPLQVSLRPPLRVLSSVSLPATIEAGVSGRDCSVKGPGTATQKVLLLPIWRVL